MRQIETRKRAGEIEAKSAAEVQAQVTEKVRNEIVRLRALVPDFYGRGAIQKTREDARDIMESIDDLREKISVNVLSPELLLRLGLHPSIIGSAEDIKNGPVPRLLDALEAVRGICRAAEKNQPGADQVKLWCVRVALRLMLQFSTKRPSAGSVDSSYCAIASLLYRGVTGKRSELRRVCQDVLRPYRGLLPT
jgi:hypothetical protein